MFVELDCDVYKIVLVDGISEDYAKDTVHEYFLARGKIKIHHVHRIPKDGGVLWERELY